MPPELFSNNMAPGRKKEHRNAYSSLDLEKAMEAVTSGQMSKRAAALKFSVPRTTLVDKLSGKYRLGKSDSY